MSGLTRDRFMKTLIEKVRSKIFAGLARREDLNHLYDQLAGLQQIQNAMVGNPILRPMRGWAISPDAMVWILADLQKRDAPSVVEFGSGQSTVIIASVLKHCGGRLISVEHDPEYSAVIRKQLAESGLADFVTTFNLPLEQSPDPRDEGIKSYDLRSLPSRPIDVALIDGPPKKNCGPKARLAPLRWCVRNLAANGSIFLDDSNRVSEQECLSALRRELPGILLTELPTEKGLTRIQRAG